MDMVLLCEDSLEGIFTAVYEAYERKQNPQETIIQIGATENFRLFCQYQEIKTDFEKAQKVAKTISTRMGEETYEIICKCLAANQCDKGQAVYQTIVLGLTRKQPRKIMEQLANDSVRKVFERSREVNNEIMHLREFLRFQELEQGILFAKIGPKCNIITFLAPHFANRFPLENFMIYDELRNQIIVHPAQKEWTLISGEQLDEEVIRKVSKAEQEYQELFTYFCHKIAIEERKNWNLQRQMLPLRFRKYMGEF